MSYIIKTINNIYCKSRYVSCCNRNMPWSFSDSFVFVHTYDVVMIVGGALLCCLCYLDLTFIWRVPPFYVWCVQSGRKADLGYTLKFVFYSSVLNFIPQGTGIPNVRWWFWTWFCIDQAYSLVGDRCGLWIGGCSTLKYPRHINMVFWRCGIWIGMVY
jgi:hypothetical protein